MKRSGLLNLMAVAILMVPTTQALAQTAATKTLAQAAAEQRIGVQTSKRVTLTMSEAVALALGNNRDIEVERINVQLNEFDLRASQGVYDPVLNTSLFYHRRTQPVASLLAGGENGKLQTTELNGMATLSKRLPWQGASVSATFEQNRATSQNLFYSLNPQFTTSLSFELTQPLWRNRKIDSARREIRLNKKRLDLSDSEFRRRAIEIIAQTQRAYWDLVFAQRDEEIKRESVGLARTQLEHNQRLVEQGTMAPVDVVSARVEVERRTDEAEAAIEAVQRAENALKALMTQPGDTEMWNAVITPVEQPQLDSSALMPLGDAMRLAFLHRPEMEQYRLRGELNQIDVEYFRNQTKPQVDLIAGYGTTGLAGSERTTTNPIVASNDLLVARVNQLSQLAGLPAVATGFNNSVPSRLVGGYGQSLGNLFRNENREWRFGVNINLPLGNRTAQAKLGHALAEGKQLDAQRQRTEQMIEVEVRNALQAVETARRRVEAAKNSRVNAELQYTSEQRRFDGGLSTNFLVLDRQNALSSARGREVKALTDYTKAVTELQRALSTTLTSNNIALASRQ